MTTGVALVSNAGSHPEEARLPELAEAAMQWYRAERARRESVAPGADARAITAAFADAKRSLSKLYDLCERWSWKV